MVSFDDVPIDVLEQFAKLLSPRDLASFKTMNWNCNAAGNRIRVPVDKIEFIEQANWVDSTMIKITGDHFAGWPTTEFKYSAKGCYKFYIRKRFINARCIEDVLELEEPTSLMELTVDYLMRALEKYRPRHLSISLVNSDPDFSELPEILAGRRLGFCDSLFLRGMNAQVIGAVLPYISAESVEIDNFEYSDYDYEASSSDGDDNRITCYPTRHFLRRARRSVVIDGYNLRDDDIRGIRAQSVTVKFCSLSAATVDGWIKDFYADREDRLVACSIRWAHIDEKQVNALSRKYQAVCRTSIQSNDETDMLFVFTAKPGASQHLSFWRVGSDVSGTYSVCWQLREEWDSST